MGPQAKHISGDGESSQAGKTQARNVHWDHGGNELSSPWPRRALRTVAGAGEATGGGETLRGLEPPGPFVPGARPPKALLVTKKPETLLFKNKLQSEAGLAAWEPERGQQASAGPGGCRDPGGAGGTSQPARGKGAQQAWAGVSHTPVGCQGPDPTGSAPAVP